MRDEQDSAFIFTQVLFEPSSSFSVKVVGRLIKQEKVRLRQKQLAKRNATTLTARKRSDIGIRWRATQSFHRHFNLTVQIPEVLAVDEILECRTFVCGFIRIVHHQLVVTVENSRFLGHTFHYVTEHRLFGIEMWLLREIAASRTVCEPSFTGEVFVETGHDL